MPRNHRLDLQNRLAAQELTGRTVLGIDAAWTAAQPSGVALAAERDGGWRLLAVAPSYADFLAQAAGLPPAPKPPDGRPDPAALLAAATRLAGAPPTLIAIDMPLALSPITRRRAADDAVSRAYGGRKCGTHSPSAERPGRLADDLRRDLQALGYPLLTGRIDQPGVIEVYPHPALVEIMPAPERVPYKAAKTRAYWPDLDRPARAARLAALWTHIAEALDRELTGVAAAFASAAPLPRKAQEDMLDAMICCAVAAHALDGRCRPFGDADAAIWVPSGTG